MVLTLTEWKRRFDAELISSGYTHITLTNSNLLDLWDEWPEAPETAASIAMQDQDIQDAIRKAG